MRKKIGLLTFCDNVNYGSFLQTYALYHCVEELGYNIELIDFRKNVPDYERSSIGGLIRSVNKFGYIQGMELTRNIFMMQTAFNKLIRKYMKTSRRYTPKTVRNCKNIYDVFLIGSDLVWDIRYANDYTYMLDFATDCSKKIAYAASCGYDHIPDSEKKIFFDNLSKFDFISVREPGIGNELQKLLRKKIETVCDPTMLLSNGFWKKLIKNNIDNNIVNKNYVLVYMPDENGIIISEAKRYARKHRMKTYIISKREKEFCPKDPLDFLTKIYYSTMVFTGSYHGLLFSVYFRKKFAYINRQPGNRINTVANKLQIQEFDILSSAFDINKMPDYEKIILLEKKFRTDSIRVLKEMLNNVY